MSKSTCFPLFPLGRRQRLAGIEISWNRITQRITLRAWNASETVDGGDISIREFFDAVGIDIIDCKRALQPWSVAPIEEVARRAAEVRALKAEDARRAAEAEEVARQACLLPLEYDPEARGEHQ